MPEIVTKLLTTMQTQITGVVIREDEGADRFLIADISIT